MINNYKEELIDVVETINKAFADIKKNNYSKEILDYVSKYLHLEINGEEYEGYDNSPIDYIRLSWADVYVYLFDKKDVPMYNLEDIELSSNISYEEAIREIKSKSEEYFAERYVLEQYEPVKEFNYVEWKMLGRTPNLGGNK